MCGNGDAALLVNFVDGLRRRLSPGDALIYPNSDEVKARCCNLLADKHSWPAYKPRKCTSKLSRKNLIMIRDSESMESLMPGLQDKSEGREQTIVEEAMNVQIRLDDSISSAFRGRLDRRAIDERARCDSNHH
jgi:hypothetical protein